MGRTVPDLDSWLEQFLAALGHIMEAAAMGAALLARAAGSERA